MRVCPQRCGCTPSLLVPTFTSPTGGDSYPRSGGNLGGVSPGASALDAFVRGKLNGDFFFFLIDGKPLNSIHLFFSYGGIYMHISVLKFSPKLFGKAFCRFSFLFTAFQSCWREAGKRERKVPFRHGHTSLHRQPLSTVCREIGQGRRPAGPNPL